MLLNEEYYKRIEAIQFTMNHDDGNSITRCGKIRYCFIRSKQNKQNSDINLSWQIEDLKLQHIPLVNENSIPEKLKKIPKTCCILVLLLNPED